jgi:hypothetical protein
MADFPTSIYSPRTKANRTGVVYDAGLTTVGFAEDVQKLDAEVVAIETDLEAGIQRLVASPAADHSVSGKIIAKMAAADLNFGDICFVDSNGKMALGDASVIATASCVAMCADASIATNASGNFLLFGVARDDTWNWTVGAKIYLSITGTTGNTLSASAPTATDEVIQIVGIALTADIILFSPQLVQVEHV